MANPTCMDSRPDDNYPQQQEIYDLIKKFDANATLADVFEPTPGGFALWLDYAGITAPGKVEYPLSALGFCGPRKEYWEHPKDQ